MLIYFRDLPGDYGRHPSWTIGWKLTSCLRLFSRASSVERDQETINKLRWPSDVPVMAAASLSRSGSLCLQPQKRIAADCVALNQYTSFSCISGCIQGSLLKSSGQMRVCEVLCVIQQQSVSWTLPIYGTPAMLAVIQCL